MPFPLIRPLAVWAVVLMTTAAPAWAQPQQQGETRVGDVASPEVRRIAPLMRQIISPVEIENVPMSVALEYWSTVTGIPMVIHEEKLENQGVILDMEAQVRVNAIPARELLNLLLQQLSNETTTLIYEVTPWFVRVMTQQQANERTVVRIYDIRDLLVAVRDFGSADTRVGGGSDDDGGGGIFGDTDEDQDAGSRSRKQRGEEIATLIRETIEPTIWQAFGGVHASIRHYNGRLIVRAPEYVHAQIGPSAQTVRLGNRARRSLPSRFYRVSPQPGSPAANRHRDRTVGVNQEPDNAAGVQGR